MKRILALLVIFMFVFLFSACGGKNMNGTSSGNGTNVGESSTNNASSGGGTTEEPEEEKPAPTPVDGDEMIDILSSTPYRNNISNGSYGLKDASVVGADELAFSKVLYPVPETVDYTYIASDYNITIDGKSNAYNLNVLLSDLKKVEGTKKIVFENGIYTLETTVNVSGVSDVYFVGNATDFVYSAWCTAFKLRDCKNIHFNDISVDYNPSPVVAGTVKSCDTDAKEITVKLGDEFNLSDTRYNKGVINYGSYMEFREDANGVLYPNGGGNLLYNSTGDNVKNIESGSYNASSNELTLKFKTMRAVSAGTKVSIAFTMYEYPTFDANGCENIYMEGCNIYCSAGMSFMFHTVHNTYLNRTNLMLKSGSDRLMTATADGFHSNDCTGDIIITGSIYENSHDDSINICSFYKNVKNYSGKKLTCASASMVTNFPINKGDEIEIYDPETFEFKGSYTVVDVEVSMLVYILTLNKYIREDLTGMIVGNATRNPKVRINDCIFRNKRNRGILLQSRNSDISNNTFSNIIHGAISLHSVLDVFAEALVPGNITITNNKFLNNNESHGLDAEVSLFAYGTNHQSVPGSIKNITIENNFMFNPARAAVAVKAGGSIKVKNNLIFNAACKKSSSDPLSAIKIYASTDVTIADNCAVNKTERDGFAVVFEETDGMSAQSGNTLKIYGGI